VFRNRNAFWAGEGIDMYSKIMVPLDGSELAECVLPHVQAITSGCKIPTVVFVRVVDPAKLSAILPAQGELGYQEKNRQQLQAQRKKAAEDYLKRIVEDTAIDNAETRYEVLEGKVAETLSDWAEKNNVDLIIIASHGRSGIGRWVMGSVADRILHSVCAPVLMIRAPGCFPGI
jgi:nucleotide-binding universal stress UspA family protein